MERGSSSGKAGPNAVLLVFFFCVVVVVLYAVIAPWDGGPSEPVPPGETAEPVPPAPQEPTVVPEAPAPGSNGNSAVSDRPDGERSAGSVPTPLPEVAEPRPNPGPPAEDDFAKDWYFQSVIGDIVELHFGDGSGRDARVGKPFDTPGAERATVVEISPDRLKVLVERASDGRRFSVPKRVVIDLTTVKPSLVEAFHFSVHGLDPERLAEGVAEPVIDGRKPERYFFAHAASKIVFNLDAGFSRFSAIGYLGGRGGKVRFIVRADGTEVFSSKPVDGPGQVDIVALLPETARTLELIVDPLGSHGADHSFWIEPILER